jgi:hypothetical protein
VSAEYAGGAASGWSVRKLTGKSEHLGWQATAYGPRGTAMTTAPTEAQAHQRAQELMRDLKERQTWI